MATQRRTRTKARKLKRRTRKRVPSSFDLRVRELIAVSPSWYYWEQDEKLRFTLMSGPAFTDSGVGERRIIGKTRWDLPMVPVGNGGDWHQHRATLLAHRPFTDFVFKYVKPDGQIVFITTSGRPVFDDDGRFTGYRGISKNITARIWSDRRLLVERSVAQILTETTSLAEATPRIIHTICEILEWVCGAHWEHDSEVGLRCAVTWGEDSSPIRDFLNTISQNAAPPARARGFVESVFDKGAPVWVRDIDKKRSFDRAAQTRACGLRTAIAFPIRDDGRTIGVMEFYDRAGYEPSADFLKGLAAVGAALGQFARRKRTDAKLSQFRAAMDASVDTIFLADPVDMQFLDFNEAACRRTGYSREEMLRMAPHELLFADRRQAEHLYAEVIAAGVGGVRTETETRAKNGDPTYLELQHRAIRLDGKTVIVSVGRDITDRKLAEHAAERLKRMYTALDRLNEAILRSRHAEELYERVCEAAVDSGQLFATSVLIVDPGSDWARTAANRGFAPAEIRDVRISIDPAVPEGRGLFAAAYRTLEPHISNDYLEDTRTLPWHANARHIGFAAVAVVPIVRNDTAIGGLAFYAREKNAFDNDVVQLLKRMAENIAYALDNFDREAERVAAEQAVRASEEKYRNVLANMNEGYFEVDLKGNFTFFNEALRRMLGRSREEMRRLNYRAYYAPESLDEVHRVFNEVYQTGSATDLIEWKYVRKNGAHGSCELSVQRIDDDTGKPVGFRGVARDTTERRRAEQALRESEEKHRAILENMNDGYFEVDLRGSYTFFNDAMCRIHGCTREEFRNANYRQFCPDDDTAKTVFRIYNEIYRTGKPARMTERPFRRKDGSLGVLQSSVQLIVDKDGQPAGFRGVARDVTDSKRAEEALRESEEKYRTILESIEDTYYEVDLNGTLVFFNSSLPRLIGYTEAELTGLNNRDFQTAEAANKAYRVFNEVFRTGRSVKSFEWELIHKDGHILLVEGSVDLKRDRKGQPIGFCGMIRDVTARRQMEIALRASEERFRSLTSLSSDWFWEQDTEFRFTKFEGKKLAGGRLDFGTAILGKRPWEMPNIVAEPGKWEHLREIYRELAPIRDLEYSYSDRKGRRYYITVNGQPMFDDAGNFQGYRGTSSDITARKREERLLSLEHMVSRNLADADDMRKALKAVLNAICESEQWQASGYFAAEEKTLTLRLVVGWSAENADERTVNFYRHQAGVVLPADGLLGEVWKTGKPRWVSDVSRESNSVWRERIAVTSERSTFCFPVVAGGRVLGVFAFASNIMREPDERLLQAASVIGNQVGQYLQRKQAEDVLRDSEERFRALTALSSDWYWEQDADLYFTRVESRRDDISEARETLVGKQPWETGYQIEGADGWLKHLDVVSAHQSYRDVVMRRTLPDGSSRYISVSGEPVFDARGEFTGYRGVSREITEQKVAEARIQYLATHDGLTDMPNRFMFNELLARAIEVARRYDRKFAVLFVDLDRFKVINDTLGHAAGDILLKETSLRLKACLRSSDIVARLGGDEFVVLLQEISEPQQVAAAAQKLLDAVTKPISIAGHECRVTASIGIAVFPGDGDNEEMLMKHADIAMYLAKDEGKNNFQFYSRSMKSQSLERLTLEAALRRALERNEFSLHYQARVGLRSGRITGVEALLRWRNAELGDVPPSQFIPLAEETGLIAAIGRWVLNTACRQSVAWQRSGLPPVRVAVNLSARQFADRDLLADIQSALAGSGLDPTLLELEITEGMVIQNPERTISLFAAIKAMGPRLAIDDFGTGYSSLAQLKRFPIDTLKIDRSFVCDIPRDKDDRAITQAIIAMAKTLELTVVAEGVETMEQAQFLREQGCDEMQGYYFSKPLTPDDFAELLHRHEVVPKRQRKKA